MNYEQVLKEKDNIDHKIELLQLRLKQLPEGKLICARNGKHYKWYISDGKNKVYLPKKERHLAEKLALKKYLTFQLTSLQQEKKALEAYLKYHDPNTMQKEISFLNTPGYKELFSPIIIPTNQDLSDWMNSSYEKNNKYPEKLIHKTLSGNYVRSKSEVLIDMVLCQNKIPFRYECALQLREAVIYPDFTILHPKTGQIYYWEHFGLMDDQSYSKNVYSKLQLYSSNGIIPMIHLITTYETKENPLTVDMVEELVRYYFK